MGICYLTRREKKEVEEQLGIYGVGTDARPNGTVIIPNKVTVLATRVFQNDKNVTKIYLPPYLQDKQERLKIVQHYKPLYFRNHYKLFMNMLLMVAIN